MKWVAVIAALSAGLILSGCPEESCKGNQDCLNGHSCTPEGDCIKTHPLEIETVILPDGVVGDPYQVTFTARGGLTPYRWNIESNLGWCSMEMDTGVFSGTPRSVVENAQVTVKVKDESYGGGEEVREQYTVSVHYCDATKAQQCSDRGDCIGGDCDCDLGYDGNQCETCADGYHDAAGECIQNQVCLPNSCSGHGTCDDTTGVVVCSCDQEYDGNYCELCKDGHHWEGQVCVVNEECPAVDPCSGHGTCDDTTGVAVCSCSEGYTGEECESCAGGYHEDQGACIKDQVCLPNSCSGHGTCDDGTGVVVCDCDDMFKGDFCEISVVNILHAQDMDEGDNFGMSVFINGEYAVVGAYHEDGGPGNLIFRAGAVYVFRRTGENTWDSGVKIIAPDAQESDGFGVSVSLDGDYLIVGSHGEDGGAGDPLPDSGAAYVFRRIGQNSWDTGTKIVAPDAQDDDWFGKSVSISGDYAVVGAFGEDGGDGNPIGNAGAAYVFRRTGINTWDSGVKLFATDPQGYDYFGLSVAIDGDYVVVGAYREDGGPGDPLYDTGAAYIFHRTGQNTWDAGVKITAYDAQWEDNFGQPVSISGDYVVIGADLEDGGDGDPASDAGAAYVFRRTGENTWDSGTRLNAPDGQPEDMFGRCVYIDEDSIIVGAWQDDGESIDPWTDSGAAYIFTRTGLNTWDSGIRIVAPDAQAGDLFGYTASAGGGYFIVGAYAEDGGQGDPSNDAGAAYVYYP